MLIIDVRHQTIFSNTFSKCLSALPTATIKATTVKLSITRTTTAAAQVTTASQQPKQQLKQLEYQLQEQQQQQQQQHQQSEKQSHGNLPCHGGGVLSESYKILTELSKTPLRAVALASFLGDGFAALGSRTPSVKDLMAFGSVLHNNQHNI
ncbi:PREDICTED: ras-related protein RabY-like, partial [Rhagoletis zephyria]|uniref:ras-related protein RabY-like n=1 Tax=Rhagoletis zephyria TaxID=28612 RepID=UPI00081171FA